MKNIFLSFTLLCLLVCFNQIEFSNATVTSFKIEGDGAYQHTEPLYPDSSVDIKATCTSSMNGSTVAFLIVTSKDTAWTAEARSSSCCENDDPENGLFCVNGFLIPSADDGGVSVLVGDETDCTGGIVKHIEIFAESDFVVTLVKTCSPSPDNSDIELTGALVYKGSYGYIEARQFPLLLFFGILSLLHLVIGIAWVGLSAYHFRVLLKLQYVIFGVILLGMTETAIWYGYYADFNSDGVPNEHLWRFSTFMGAIKKTIARVFVLLVSLGYGVVKPTLGTVTIYKVAGLGVLFFICTAAYDLHDTPGAAPDFAKSVLAIPLSLVNAIFFWWILVELYGVYRSLELKHQELKMKMYKNLGIFLLVILLLSLASGVFEVYCAQNRLYDHYWEIYWLQYAIWHMLFFAVLVFIVIVWRPTSNNTRYAYTALDSDDDDGETNGAPTPTGFGDIKLRTRESYKQDDADENLQWAEENIPTASQALVAALDEETNAEDIETWRSKMQ